MSKFVEIIRAVETIFESDYTFEDFCENVELDFEDNTTSDEEYELFLDEFINMNSVSQDDFISDASYFFFNNSAFESIDKLKELYPDEYKLLDEVNFFSKV